VTDRRRAPRSQAASSAIMDFAAVEWPETFSRTGPSPRVLDAAFPLEIISRLPSSLPREPERDVGICETSLSLGVSRCPVSRTRTKYEALNPRDNPRRTRARRSEGEWRDSTHVEGLPVFVRFFHGGYLFLGSETLA